MSSSNRVALRVKEEAEYGTTPAGDWFENSFTSESLTGTPQTIESQALRSDRQNGGQVTVGLELSGGFEAELSAEPSIQFFIEQAMMSDETPATASIGSVDISVGGSTTISGSGFTGAGLEVGDIVVLSGFSNADNNQPVLVTAVTDSELTVVGDGLSNESGGSLLRSKYFDIGTVRKSCTISKEFLDIDVPEVRSIVYAGMRTGEMAMSFTYGEIATVNFGLAGNGYDLPSVPATDGDGITDTAGSQPLDSSNQMGWLLTDNQLLDICIESLGINLNNNLQAQNCIGHLAPQNQIPFTAAIGIEAGLHLGPTSFDIFMPAKLSQQPVSIHFYTRDFDGKGYAISMPRVQLSFPDPTADGRDQHVMLAASGAASYDGATGNSMRVYILE